MNTSTEKYQGLTMEAKQITHRTDGSDMQGIHWDVTVSKGKQSLTLEYTEGLGNFVDYKYGVRPKDGQGLDDTLVKWITNEKLDRVDSNNINYFTSGVTKRVKFAGNKINITPPKLGDIIQCLSMEAQAINETFEDWASGCGYSSDSIKAKDMYDTCIKRAIELKQLGVDLDALAEEMEDY